MKSSTLYVDLDSNLDPIGVASRSLCRRKVETSDTSVPSIINRPRRHGPPGVSNSVMEFPRYRTGTGTSWD